MVLSMFKFGLIIRVVFEVFWRRGGLCFEGMGEFGGFVF